MCIRDSADSDYPVEPNEPGNPDEPGHPGTPEQGTTQGSNGEQPAQAEGHGDKELPDTGEENNNKEATLFGGLFAALGSALLFGRRKKNKEQ